MSFKYLDDSQIFEKKNLQDINKNQNFNRKIFNFFINPERNGFKSLLIITSLFIPVGSIFCFDYPGTTTRELVNRWNLNNLIYYTLLYTIYFFPNMFFPMFKNLISKKTGLVFFAFGLIGQLFYSISFYVDGYSIPVLIAMIGRFFLGISEGIILYIQSKYFTKWFKQKTLIRLFSLKLFISRFIRGMNFIITPLITYYMNIQSATTVGIIMMIISFLLYVMLLLLNNAGDKYYKQLAKTEHDSHFIIDDVKFKHILKFPKTSWMLIFISSIFQSTVITFFMISSYFFEVNYSSVYKPEEEYYYISEQDDKFLIFQSDLLSAIPLIISSVLSPVMFSFLYNKGRKLIYIFIGVLFVLISYILLIIDVDSIYIPITSMILFGIGYSITTSLLWTLFVLMVKKKYLASIITFLQISQNFFLFISSIVIGILSDRSYSYSSNIFFFIGMLIVCLAFTLIIIIVDCSTERSLNSPSKDLDLHVKNVNLKKSLEKEGNMINEVNGKMNREDEPLLFYNSDIKNKFYSLRLPDKPDFNNYLTIAMSSI
eukprot:TRINITY_DN13587_c0_g1_i1.p1 TRINITY_DN13587_c0_g1~~TRINITY_DN13587_c0_g1_i1.p1  ORF type:complete len:542 (-),score=56.65 TRINITY_DN13587_c0_g1_i1:128-1753(-)